jgi:predicted flavoprotein YhiN
LCRLDPLSFRSPSRPSGSRDTADLAGIALDVEASCDGGRFRESLLFTHRGLSGPAILQISSYWDGKSPLSIDLMPGADAGAWFRINARRRRESTTCSRSGCHDASSTRGAPSTTPRRR